MKTNEFMGPSTTAEQTTPTPLPTKRTWRPRLITTYYYNSADDSADQWKRMGRACTTTGAARAAIVKLLDGGANHADIYGEDGVRVGFMTRKGKTIRMVMV